MKRRMVVVAFVLATGCTASMEKQQTSLVSTPPSKRTTEAKEQIWDGAVSAALRQGTLDDTARAMASMWWSAQGPTAFAGEPYLSMRLKWKGDECQKYSQGKMYRFDQGHSNVDRYIWNEATNIVMVVRKSNFLKQSDVLPFTQRVASHIGYATLFNEPPACVCDPMAVMQIRTICRENYKSSAERYRKALT